MKISKYNIIFDYKEKKFAFNSMTCALALASNAFLKIIKEIEMDTFNKVPRTKIYQDLIEDMKKGGFIVDDCFDELNFLRFKNLQGKFQTNRFSMSIAPTYTCNFDCPYCYEKTRVEFMNQEVMDGICREVKNAAGNKNKIDIAWYGGEPLLAKDTIWSLSEKFMSYVECYGADYSAQIITNGYLMDADTIENFLNYKISRVQVTLDGPAKVHDARRKLKNSSKPTFNVIIKNIKKALDAGIGVAIRVNIDKNNEHCTDELLDILLENELQNAYVYLGHVKPSTDYCKSISDTCLSKEDYALKFADFEKTLIKKGFSFQYYPNYPMPKSNYCSADSINSKVIAPDGSVYKCWHDISNADMCIGNIVNLARANAKSIMTQVGYILFNPFVVDKCRECNVLPLCMGGCPTISNKVTCQSSKYSLIETLKIKCDVLLGVGACPNTAAEEKRATTRLCFLVDPVTTHDVVVDQAAGCPDYSASCGSPKLWWRL